VTETTSTPEVNRAAAVSLREITGETVRAICRLSDTLTPGQRKMVAPNAVSIAQAHFEPHAWFRAVYAGETPVGFIMLYIGPEDDAPDRTVYYLWRFMIARPYQKFGFGRRALSMVIEDLRQRGAPELVTSVGQGRASPEGFYRRLGFVRNGQMYDEEIGLALQLSPQEAAA
jgi:diamine N-acetyltransferase